MHMNVRIIYTVLLQQNSGHNTCCRIEKNHIYIFYVTKGEKVVGRRKNNPFSLNGSGKSYLRLNSNLDPA